MKKELILRLSKYKRLLHKLKALGLEKVYSNNLGDAIGVTPALVRKDFSLLKIPGHKRGGYQIDTVKDYLDKALGTNESKDVVIVGCGKIGRALIQYKEFGGEGLKIVAGFDLEPEKVSEDTEIPIFHTSKLTQFIKDNKIKIGVIAVPDAAASLTLDTMVSAGIRGILNFAPVELKNSGQCIIHNVNIGLELENLFYLVNMEEKMHLNGE
jgi:redox-sensing transcriptional repressor